MISPGSLSEPSARAIFLDDVSRIVGSVGPSIAALQLRERWDAVPFSDWVAFSLELSAILSPEGIPLMVNRNRLLCDAADLAGIHFGKDQREAFAPWLSDAGRRPGLAGYSAHHPDELADGTLDSLSYVLFAPVFQPQSKHYSGALLGFSGLEQARRVTRVPIYALGGIDASRVAECRRTGVSGVACISSVFSAREPAAAAAELVNAWGRALVS